MTYTIPTNVSDSDLEILLSKYKLEELKKKIKAYVNKLIEECKNEKDIIAS
jgi:hypothetical protein